MSQESVRVALHRHLAQKSNEGLERSYRADDSPAAKPSGAPWDLLVGRNRRDDLVDLRTCTTNKVPRSEGPYMAIDIISYIVGIALVVELGAASMYLADDSVNTRFVYGVSENAVVVGVTGICLLILVASIYRLDQFRAILWVIVLQAVLGALVPTAREIFMPGTSGTPGE